ncbi:MAG: prepilin peptidase [Lachnospiraceae bacterium]|nr:prepilin peptidase [Lachnospiraceae bacterium]
MMGTAMQYALAIIIGLLLGGFVGDCIYRFSKKIGFAKKASCDSCNAKLSLYDLIPLVSFLLLKGRCRSCGAKVNIQYPLVELANGVLYMIVFMANGWNLQSAIYCLMTSAFLVISIVDEKTFEIPLACNLFIGGLGIIWCVIDYHNLISYLIGFVCVSGALYLLYIITGGALIGGGDVKLMAAAGLLLGWKDATLAFFLACILGSVIHVIRMKVSKKAEHVLAMGPYLCMALWICALWGDKMIEWYLHFLIS